MNDAADGRTALVTGGSSGIGLAIARMLVEERFDVTIASRNPEKLETAARQLAAVISLTDSLNAETEEHRVRAMAICPGFVDTPMARISTSPREDMIQPADCAEVVRMALRLSPQARIPEVMIERVRP